MKKITQDLQDRLLDYIDNTLPVAERKRLELLMEHDVALRALYHELKKLHLAWNELPLEEPSKNFTQVLMARLNEGTAHNRVTVRNGIFLLSIVLLVVIVASVLLSAGVFDNATAMVNPNDLGLTQRYFPNLLPSFSLNLKLLINMIIVLNLGLAWIVLDRVVLKPFFQKRWEGMMN